MYFIVKNYCFSCFIFHGPLLQQFDQWFHKLKNLWWQCHLLEDRVPWCEYVQRFVWFLEWVWFPQSSSMWSFSNWGNQTKSKSKIEFVCYIFNSTTLTLLPKSSFNYSIRQKNPQYNGYWKGWEILTSCIDQRTQWVEVILVKCNDRNIPPVHNYCCWNNDILQNKMFGFFFKWEIRTVRQKNREKREWRWSIGWSLYVLSEQRENTAKKWQFWKLLSFEVVLKRMRRSESTKRTKNSDLFCYVPSKSASSFFFLTISRWTLAHSAKVEGLFNWWYFLIKLVRSSFNSLRWSSFECKQMKWEILFLYITTNLKLWFVLLRYFERVA